MYVFVRCRKGGSPFRVSVISEKEGLKTGWDCASYFSLSLLLRMIVNYYPVGHIHVECQDPKVIEIIKQMAINDKKEHRSNIGEE